MTVLAVCPVCLKTRVVVSAGTKRARLRSHHINSQLCAGSLQPPTRTKET